MECCPAWRGEARGALWRRGEEVTLINVLVHALVCEELGLNIEWLGTTNIYDFLHDRALESVMVLESNKLRRKGFS